MPRKIHRKQFALAACGLVVLICGLAWADESAADESGAKLLAMMNAVRVSAGVPALTADKRIDDAATLHLAEFVTNQTVSDQFEGEPTLLERLRMAEVPGATAGEIMLKAASLDQVLELLKRADIQKLLVNPAYSVAGSATMQSGDALFIVANLVRPLQALSAEEVENLVVDAVQQSRLRVNLTAFKVIPLPQLRASACEMVKKDSLKVQPVDVYSGHLNAPSEIHNFTFTAADPRILPGSIENAGGDPKINSISVGVCYGKSKSYPDGTYWVGAILYRTKVSVR